MKYNHVLVNFCCHLPMDAFHLKTTCPSKYSDVMYDIELFSCNTSPREIILNLLYLPVSIVSSEPKKFVIHLYAIIHHIGSCLCKVTKARMPSINHN